MAVAVSWREQAACRGVDPERFWPTSFASKREMAFLRRLCGGCPVRAECLEDARRFEEGQLRIDFSGFRAGLSASERAGVWAAGV